MKLAVVTDSTAFLSEDALVVLPLSSFEKFSKEEREIYQSDHVEADPCIW